jgi:hypothetical protein
MACARRSLGREVDSPDPVGIFDRQLNDDRENRNRRGEAVAGWRVGTDCGGVRVPTPEFFVSVADKGLTFDARF